MTTRKTWTLYVLKLEHCKYYVGITSQQPEQRFREHLNGRKSYWTEKYPPIKIIQTVKLGDLDEAAAKQYENRVVRKYIKEKGINNVRGGHITGKSDLVVRFGYIFDALSWEAFLTILFQSAVIAVLLIDRYANG